MEGSVASLPACPYPRVDPPTSLAISLLCVQRLREEEALRSGAGKEKRPREGTGAVAGKVGGSGMCTTSMQPVHPLEYNVFYHSCSPR